MTKEDGEISDMPEIKTEILALKTHVNEVVKAHKENTKWIEVAKKQAPKPSCKMINDTMKNIKERQEHYMYASLGGKNLIMQTMMPENYVR